MATETDMDALIGRFDAATNKVAETLKKLRDEIATGGLTAEAEARIAAKLDVSIAALEALGADTTDPVPA